MIRLLLDQGLPHTTVKHLNNSSWDVQHVSDVGLSLSTDRETLNAAQKDSGTLVTLDAMVTVTENSIRIHNLPVFRKQ